MRVGRYLVVLKPVLLAVGGTEASRLRGCVILTKWFSFPRLETRTKESSMYASTGVTKPPCAMKVKGPLLGLR